MKGEAFTFNHEGQSRKGNKHPLAPTEAVGGGEKQRGGQESGRGIGEGEQSDMNHKVHGGFSFWQTAPGMFPKSVLLLPESAESEIITGTSESVTKLFRKHLCFWEA